MKTDAVIPNYNLHRIIDFNFSPVSEMDDSWWPQEHVTVALFKQLKKISAARRKLSDFILTRYQLKKEVYSDFSTPEKRIALLSSADLKALLYSLGLMIESDTIADVIEKEAQQAIKQSLGEEDYLYALKNRMVMRRLHRSDKMTTRNNKTYNYSDFRQQVYQSGLHCLLSLLDGMPKGFIQRILFKLPKTWDASLSNGSKDDYHYMSTHLPRLFKEFKLS
ncbi:MAG: SctK family type III secretion system sorting platform protein [Chromatiales bacterium]|nr:SctK family type III secretion system sorting platform protein [Chromatiales bacterium]